MLVLLLLLRLGDNGWHLRLLLLVIELFGVPAWSNDEGVLGDGMNIAVVIKFQKPCWVLILFSIAAALAHLTENEVGE